MTALITQIQQHYEAGQRLNMARWALEQAFMLGNRNRWSQAKNLCRQLRQSVILLASSPKKRRRFLDSLDANLRWAGNYFDSESLADALFYFEQKLLQEGLNDSALEIAWQELRERGPDFLDSIIKPFRKLIGTANKQKTNAFDFGELVDQGLRPLEVWRHMVEMSDDPRSNSGFPGPQILKFHFIEAGSVPPGATWFEEVKAFWERLGLPSSLAPFPAIENDSQQNMPILEIVGQIGMAVRDSDKLLSSTLPNPPATLPAEEALDSSKANQIPKGESIPTWKPGPMVNGNLKIGGLFFKGTQVRTVPGKAKNVITLINAFEKSNWDSSVDNPFVRSGVNNKPEIDPEKLNETTKTLNRGMKFIRFSAEGGGSKVCWKELLQPHLRNCEKITGAILLPRADGVIPFSVERRTRQ